MKKHQTLIITTIICLIPMVIAALIYDRLPDPMVTHWASDGTPNGYSSRAFACFGLPGIMVGVNLLVNIFLDNDPKRKNMGRMMVLLGKWCVPVINLIACTTTLAIGMGYEISIEKIMPAFIGLLFLAVGNYLPKCKQNYTAGIKLPWTLNSEENWNKTHHLAGYLFILCGVLMIVTMFIPKPEWIILPVILITAFAPMIYSFLLYKRGI